MTFITKGRSIFNVFAELTICHTCIMLSSDTEQITQGSFGFQEKSEILAVCPPWMNCQNNPNVLTLDVSKTICRNISRNVKHWNFGTKFERTHTHVSTGSAETLILLFSKDTLNWSKVTCIMLQNHFILNKWCSFKLAIQRILCQNILQIYKITKQQNGFQHWQ